VITDKLRFKQFEKQNAICPDEAEFEGDIVNAFVARRAEVGHLLLVEQGKLAFDFINRFFEQRAVVASRFSFALNQLFAFLGSFFKPDDVQKLGVKVSVECAAVEFKRLFEQVKRRKDFIQRD
jgi:hypothetical protein